jgi:hypothetical protein
MLFLFIDCAPVYCSQRLCTTTERREDTSPLVTVVWESTEPTLEVVVMPEVSTTTES